MNRFLSFSHVTQQAQRNEDKIVKKIRYIIRSSNTYFDGKETRRLESHMLDFLDKGFVTLVASGHDALLMALSSLNLVKDDEVIFPVNAYPTAFPVCMTAAKAIPVDTDKNGQMSPINLKKAINAKTKAIIIVHLYGMTGDVSEIVKLAKSQQITLIEDCAQSFGTYFKKKPLGTFGDIACFSFYPTKNISTLGDGGALYTKSKKLFSFFLQAKSYGELVRYKSTFIAGHSRLSELQAGILNVYFNSLQVDFEKRKRKALQYKILLSDKVLTPHIRMLTSHKDSDAVPHLLVIEARKRDALRQFLMKKHITTLIHYPFPIHLVKAFSFLGYHKGNFPVAERLSRSVVSLPFHQYLSRSDIVYIVDSIKEFYEV